MIERVEMISEGDASAGRVPDAQTAMREAGKGRERLEGRTEPAPISVEARAKRSPRPRPRPRPWP